MWKSIHNFGGTLQLQFSQPYRIQKRLSGNKISLATITVLEKKEGIKYTK